jgi:arylsulfatase A-like enzyme
MPWRNVRLDLASLAGQEVRFEFSCLHAGGRALPASFPLWGHPAIYAPGPLAKGAKASNVILISLDTLSARHLNLYGYDKDTAPKMAARFQNKGVVFDRCVAAATATAPTHMTMFTGMDPLQHKMTDGLGHASLSAIPLAEVLRPLGITTAAFTEDGWLSVGHGFGRGFDRFFEDSSPDMMAPVGRIESTFRHASEWLEENRDKSFFLFLHTFEVHDPHHPPEAYQGLFFEKGEDPREPTVARVVRDRVAYDQEIRYVDDQLEALMRKIEDLGLAESTLVIVTADHGEAFGEHGYVVHGNFMYEEVLHVPLMMQGPGVRPGTRVKDIVGHVDYMPTILEALGATAPHPHLRGKSLYPYLADGTSSRPDRQHRVLYSESWGKFALTSERQMVEFLAPALSARIGGRKLSRYKEEPEDRYEAYDLDVDPAERTNLFRNEAERFADLRKLVDDYHNYSARTRERLEKNEPAESESGEVILSPEQEEKLRALGYIE